MSEGPPPRPGQDNGTVAASDATRWHRLHPLSPVVRGGRAAYALLILVLVRMPTRGGAGPFQNIEDVVILTLVVIGGVVSWLVTRWRIEDGTLRIETGLIRRQSLRFALVQIQAIDTVRPFLARALGLSELRVRMAGHSGSSGRLAYLRERDADGLRARLLALAHGLAEHTPAPPERVLFTVPTGRLIGSIALSPLGVAGAALVVAMISGAVVTPAATGAYILATFAFIVTMATALWRRFNGSFELTVSEAPDGLRVRAGLIATSAETIPRGRVQAVRMVEPLLWRPLGWCRVQADVAGRHRGEGESGAERGQLRTLLPVGTSEQAWALLARIVPDAPADRIPAPRRVRLKSPLRFHYLSWGRNDTCVVSTSGRVARTTDWVPLAKVQSLRRVQGPVQRRLRLATIHADTAGRSVHAALRDRDTAEADRVLVDLVDLCRTARRWSDGARPVPAQFRP